MALPTREETTVFVYFPTLKKELYLACYTEQEIAEMLGVDRTTVSKWIGNVKNGQLTENHIPDSFQLYNLWQFKEEIAEVLGVAQQTISSWISNTKNGQLTKNGIPESLQFYNLW